MDLVSIIFYGVVCGCLGFAAPSLGGRMMRLGIGAAVGVATAIILPLIRGMAGY